jgi:hypothetical protein
MLRMNMFGKNLIARKTSHAMHTALASEKKQVAILKLRGRQARIQQDKFTWRDERSREAIMTRTMTALC